MKTTIKEFILKNMTDLNFEKIVNQFTISSISDRYYNYEDKSIQYLKSKGHSYTESDTFEILQQIQQMPDNYKMNYKEEFSFNSVDNLSSIVDLIYYNPNYKTSEPEINKINSSLEDELDDELEIDLDYNMEELVSDNISRDILDDFEFDFLSSSFKIGENSNLERDTKECLHFYNLEIDFLSRNLLVDSSKMINIYSNTIDNLEINNNNYKEYFELLNISYALGLANFLYEILHFTSKEKMKNIFEEFSQEDSLVKIKYDNKNESYDLYILVDNRSLYASNDMYELNYDGYDHYKDSVKPVQPRFVDWDELQEGANFLLSEHILAPFVNYLNEEITISNASEEETQNILYSLITTLTAQGFTKVEQIEYIDTMNYNYEQSLKL